MYVGALTILALALVATPAAADTLLMPRRDFLMNTSEVVWGVTTQPNGTNYVIDFGDGTPQVSGNVAAQAAGSNTDNVDIWGESITDALFGNGME